MASTSTPTPPPTSSGFGGLPCRGSRGLPAARGMSTACRISSFVCQQHAGAARAARPVGGCGAVRGLPQQQSARSGPCRGFPCATLALCGAGLCFLRRRSEAELDLLRLVAFVLLHLADYATNVLTMCISGAVPGRAAPGAPGDRHVLRPRGAVVQAPRVPGLQDRGGRCRNRRGDGLHAGDPGRAGLRGLQAAWAAADGCLARAAGARRGPGALPLQGHGRHVREGTVFALVVMYFLLNINWDDKSEDENWNFNHRLGQHPWMVFVLQASAVLSIVTTGLALMEVDHRTSSAVQRALDGRVLAQARHLAFRTSELALRS
ncbi:unnamed protein product, partial [Prorocentrum cordatum]